MASFPTTRWSRVVAAGDGDRDALQVLCTAYWQPLYSFARRAGAAPEEAQEQVQDFLGAFVARNDFARVSDDRGRFRSYLLRAFRNHCAKRRARERAIKRGGGAAPVAWEDVEPMYAESEARSPEEEFERQWARRLVERAKARVAEAYAQRQPLLNALFPMLSGNLDRPYAELGTELGMSEGAVKVAAHRLRRRFRDALRAEVSDTIADPSHLDDELRHLMAAL